MKPSTHDYSASVSLGAAITYCISKHNSIFCFLCLFSLYGSMYCETVSHVTQSSLMLAVWFPLDLNFWFSSSDCWYLGLQVCCTVSHARFLRQVSNAQGWWWTVLPAFSLKCWDYRNVLAWLAVYLSLKHLLYRVWWHEFIIQQSDHEFKASLTTIKRFCLWKNFCARHGGTQSPS